MDKWVLDRVLDDFRSSEKPARKTAREDCSLSSLFVFCVLARRTRLTASLKNDTCLFLAVFLIQNSNSNQNAEYLGSSYVIVNRYVSLF